MNGLCIRPRFDREALANGLLQAYESCYPSIGKSTYHVLLTGMKVLDVFLVSVPEAPSQVSVITIMETSLQVSWRQANSLDLILQYMVEVKSGAGDWEQVNDTIQGSSVLVENLNSFTVHSFRVRAKNGLGTSPYSQPSPNVTTLEGGMRKDFH